MKTEIGQLKNARRKPIALSQLVAETPIAQNVIELRPAIGDFEELLTRISGELVDYSYRSTPRTRVSGKIYTSTSYPAHQTIPLHNEMSYSRQWPMIIGFLCVEPSPEGGETPLADSREVFAQIDPAVREEFSRKQVMYVRNYDDDL